MITKSSILLVEHNTGALKEMQSQLKSLGYRVAAMATSGEQALEKARVIRPDLVLMNMRIKGKMGGVKAAEFIRKRLGIPVVFLLENEDEKTLSWIKETARCEYLLKPIEESRTFRTIEMILAKQWAEKQLREKEQWLNAVLENIQDAVIITDREGCIIRLNALAEDLTGWNQGEARGRDIHAVFPILHLKTREPLGNPVSKVLITGHVDTAVKQAMLRTRTGKEVPIENSVAPILLGKDDIGGAILVFCDATERLRIKEELNKSTHDLGKRVRELNCLYAISKLVERPGIRLEELLNETANLVLSAMEYPEVACARIRLNQNDFCTANFAESPWGITAHIAVRGERSGSLEVYYLQERPDGDYGPFLKEEWALINDVAERLGRIIGRKRTEEAFQLEKAQFEQLFESAQEAVVISECDGRVRLINSEFTRLFGYTQEEAEGRLVDDLVAPEKRYEEARVITRRVASMQNVALETVRWRKNGTPIEVSLLGSPIVINGEQVGVYGIYRDITERKRSEEILKRKTHQQVQLLRTTRHLTTSLELTEVLTRIGTGAKDILKANSCTIYLLVNDGTMLNPVVALDPEYEQESLAALLSVDNSFTGQAVKAKRGLIFNDTVNSPLGHQIPGTPLEEDERVIVVPFRTGDEVHGAMCLARNGNMFSEEDLGLAEAFAAYATTALKNAQNYDDLQREIEERKQAESALWESRKKIEGLHQVTRSLEACRSEDEAYRLTVQAAEKILDLTMCSLDVVEGNNLVVKATTSKLPPEASVESDLRETSLATKTYHSGKTIIFGNLDEVPDASPTRPDFRSGISAPIGDFGVFQAVSKDTDAFNEEDAGLLELLLGHTAEAVRRIRLQDELRDQAARDPLTGAFNRRYFRESIERELERSKRSGQAIGFLLVDVDKFKKINDTYGHQVGDRVLRAVAGFLKSQVRAAEMVVRYGGDEFLIVITELEDSTDNVRQRLAEAFDRWYQANKVFDFPVRLSIGGAKWHPVSSGSVEDVLAEADRQMYQDKRKRSAAVDKE